MANTTPFVKRMRTQGGTIYTFSSATEDIGLNINERNNVVKPSHYALLNIPSIDAPDNLQQNKFNVLAIPGAFNSFLTGNSVKDGRVVIAESFQNYALNLEANLLSKTSYNPSLTATVAERVFWKWMKETGAIRWTPINTSAGTYWQEETDTDTSVGYNSIVKCVGQISAGAVRTDSFGTYNETYVLVPTSFGQTPVYFKQVEDDNYQHGMSVLDGNLNILGRETYTKPHPDGLDLKAYYDIDASNKMTATYNMQYDYSVGSWTNGWWPTAEGISFTDYSYYTDISTYLTSGKYNINLQYYLGGSYVTYKRSVVDCLSIEYNLDNLKTIYNDSTLTFDDIAIEKSIDDTFDFNAVLIYYSVYNSTEDILLATNLWGILFLDPPSGNTSNYPISEITLPSITKIQSGPSGFGTSYSFRINIKSDYTLDDTAAIVTDTTSAQTVLSDFTDVFDSLGKSVSILNQQSSTINYIYQQYLDMSSQFTDIVNDVNDIQTQVNDIAVDITGSENAIAMFSAGNDPLVDSSIFMKNGNVGIFNNNPQWGLHVDSSMKVKDIIIENAIRDTNGNILLGYGSPLQIGSPNSVREIRFYTGTATPAFSIDSSNNVNIGNQSGPYLQESSIGTYFYWSGGKLEPSAGTGNVTSNYVDGSLAKRDASMNILFALTNASLNQIKASYLPNASLGTSLLWVGGYLEASIAGGVVGVSLAYVNENDISIRLSVTEVSTRLNSYSTNASIGTALGSYATNASIGTAAFAKNASFNSYATNASVNTAFGAYATNASVNLATAGFAPIASPTFTGTPNADTAANPYTTSSQLATTQFVQSRVQLSDTSIARTWTSAQEVSTRLNVTKISTGEVSTRLNAYTTNASANTAFISVTEVSTRLNAYTTNASANTAFISVTEVSTRLNVTRISVGEVSTRFDSSIKSLDSAKATKASPTFTTSFGIGSWTFEPSDNNSLVLRYNGVTKFQFTTDGSILAAGEITTKFSF